MASPASLAPQAPQAPRHDLTPFDSSRAARPTLPSYWPPAMCPSLHRRSRTASVQNKYLAVDDHWMPWPGPGLATAQHRLDQRPGTSLEVSGFWVPSRLQLGLHEVAGGPPPSAWRAPHTSEPPPLALGRSERHNLATPVALHCVRALVPEPAPQPSRRSAKTAHPPSPATGPGSLH